MGDIKVGACTHGCVCVCVQAALNYTLKPAWFTLYKNIIFSKAFDVQDSYND